jgi:hypothetical protein
LSRSFDKTPPTNPRSEVSFSLLVGGSVLIRRIRAPNERGRAVKSSLLQAATKLSRLWV